MFLDTYVFDPQTLIKHSSKQQRNYTNVGTYITVQLKINNKERYLNPFLTKNNKRVGIN